MNNSHANIGFLLLALLLLLPIASALNSNSFSFKPISSKTIPAMYVFGDSLVDSGNNNYLKLIPPESKADKLPFGIDFGGIPTGRYTNGKTVVDYIAILLGLPLAPPYLGLSKHQRSKIRTGINYASGGSGLLSETNNMTSLTAHHQIKLFQRTVENDLPKQFKQQANLKRHLSESLFVVSFGVNDYGHIQHRTTSSIRSFALHLLHEFSKHLQTLYRLGARNFFVNNIGPAGCFPSTAIKMRPRGDCNISVNKMISSYNKRLPGVLYELQSKLPGFTFLHADLYGFLLGMRTSGHKYGIVQTWKPCCPNSIEGDLKCRPNIVPCEDRDNYLYFGDHPSQIANHLYAIQCYDNSTICMPFNLQHFVHRPPKFLYHI